MLWRVVCFALLSIVSGAARALPTLPLCFAPDGGGGFAARGLGYSVHLSASGNALLSGTCGRVLLRLAGKANAAPRVVPQSKLPAMLSDLRGCDRAKWRMNVPLWRTVAYKNVYSGIDLLYYGHSRPLEYDFVVQPHADPRRITVRFDGAQHISVDKTGALHVRAAGGTDLRWQKPVLYQIGKNGTHQSVAGRFRVRGGREVSFAVGSYNHFRPLVIDPVLAASTFLGGGGGDYAHGLACDAAGNAYMAVTTNSTNFPGAGRVPHGGYDVVVCKLNPSGTALLHATLLGGSSDDQADALAVDPSGAVYVGGTTASADFPTTPGALKATLNAGRNYDGFLCKLNAAGDGFVYSTLLGGSGSDFVQGLAVNTGGEAFAVGVTNSADFPTTPGAAQTRFGGVYDAFLSKLSADGTSLAYSTFIGGSDYDDGAGVALDTAGNAYITGEADSTNFPVTSGAFQTAPGDDTGVGDAFVAKIVPSGTSFAYCTLLGGEENDYGTGIAVGDAGNAYVCGLTASADFPTTAGAFAAQFNPSANSMAFVAKLGSAGNALSFCTLLGGGALPDGTGGDDYATALAVDPSGGAWVTGWTDSPNFPATAGTAQAMLGGSAGTYDAFVAHFSADGRSLPDASFCGGMDNEGGASLALDASGGAWVCGQTASTNFPALAGAAQSTSGGGDSDAFLVRFAPSSARATDAAGIANGATRVLWTDGTGRAQVRTVSAAGQTMAGTVFGPYAGWSVSHLTVGTDSSTRLLWTRSDGAASVWTINANNSISYGPVLGPFTGWTASGIVSGGADGSLRLLWTRTDGAASVWTVAANGSISYGAVLGPFTGWSVGDMAAAGANAYLLLWTRTDGAISVWTISSTIAYGTVFGPYAGWSAKGLGAGANGSTRLVWANADGRASVWSVGAGGAVSYGPTYGPFAGWTPVRGTVGADGVTRLLWNNPNGQGGLWLLDASGTARTYLSLSGF